MTLPSTVCVGEQVYLDLDLGPERNFKPPLGAFFEFVDSR